MIEPNSPDIQTELSKERNRIAADRTLLTWVRTSVSFIGLGFGSRQILDVLEDRLQPHWTAKVPVNLLSLLLIGLAVFIAIAAAMDYQKELSRLRQTSYFYRSRPSLSLIVGGSVAIASVIAFLVMW